MIVIVIKEFDQHQVEDLIEVDRARRIELLKRGLVAISYDDHRERMTLNRSSPERIGTTSHRPKEER
jgi:hypothetical protein